MLLRHGRKKNWIASSVNGRHVCMKNGASKESGRSASNSRKHNSLLTAQIARSLSTCQPSLLLMLTEWLASILIGWHDDGQRTDIQVRLMMNCALGFTTKCN